jgi:hypothetical protein
VDTVAVGTSIEIELGKFLQKSSRPAMDYSPVIKGSSNNWTFRKTELTVFSSSIRGLINGVNCRGKGTQLAKWRRVEAARASIRLKLATLRYI